MRPPALKVLAVVALALSCAWLVSRLAASVQVPEPATGHFLAYRVGAELVAEGRGSDLYDLGAQGAVQRRLEADRPRSRVEPYVNPPGLAMVLAPLTSVPFLRSFGLWKVAMAAAALGGVVALLRATPELPSDAASRVAVGALVLGYAPMITSITGGQNTPLTFGLLALAWAGVTTEVWWLAGLAVGLLTYKPQYAVVAALLLLVTGQRRALGLAIGVGLGHTFLAALVCGFDWPLDYLRAIRAYGEWEASAGRPTHVAWLQATQWTLPRPYGVALGHVGSMVVVARALWTSRRDPTSRLGLAALLAAGLVATPHFHYDDAGLVAIPVVIGLALTPNPGTATRLWFGAGWLAWPAWNLAPLLGFQPLTVMLLALWGWLDRQAGTAATARGR